MCILLLSGIVSVTPGLVAESSEILLDNSILLPATDIKVGMIDYNPTLGTATFVIIERMFEMKYEDRDNISPGEKLYLLPDYYFFVRDTNEFYVTLSVSKRINEFAVADGDKYVLGYQDFEINKNYHNTYQLIFKNPFTTQNPPVNPTLVIDSAKEGSYFRIDYQSGWYNDLVVNSIDSEGRIHLLLVESEMTFPTFMEREDIHSSAIFVPEKDIKIGMVNFDPSKGSTILGVIEGGVVTGYVPLSNVFVGQKLDLLSDIETSVTEVGDNYIELGFMRKIGNIDLGKKILDRKSVV